jgi:hypothetical protein
MPFAPTDRDPYALSLACALDRSAMPDSTPVTKEEVEAFAGRNGREYWDLFQAPVAPLPLLAGFSFAAAVFHVVWMLYRKMYWEAVASWFVAIPVWIVWVSRFESAGAMSAALRSLSPLVLMAAWGTLGNGLYLRRIRATVAKVRQQECDPKQRLTLLSARGGTSWFAPAIFVILHVVATALLAGCPIPK